MRFRNTNACVKTLIASILLFLFLNIEESLAKEFQRVNSGNFGLPGIIDLPTGRRFPDGEIVIMQQVHKSLARSGISFQALPYIGFAFRYSGHGHEGTEAHGRFNHDRSFDAHLSILDESKYWPAISIGLRDFIGTGQYSSEYIASTKSIGSFNVTMGLGFGRLAGRNTFSNPFTFLSPRFEKRMGENFGKGGTLGSINWFQGNAAAFYGLNYRLGKRGKISAEYTSDLMSSESGYMEIKSPWNIGASYQLNKTLNLAAQFLHGSQASVTATIAINPNSPPKKGGMELAPVPMRLRTNSGPAVLENNETIIKKVLAADNFVIHKLGFTGDTVNLVVSNTKFRTTSQATGRIASTLQRFTSDNVKFAYITFQAGGLETASYKIDLSKITEEQFDAPVSVGNNVSISAVDLTPQRIQNIQPRHSWGVGPYVTHRLFNPDLPLSMETGLEVAGAYRLSKDLKISGAIRKSILTNLTDNKQRSDSVLPRVHSDWARYDFGGQKGHIHELKLSYTRNLAPGLYGRAHAGLLEPFFAGFGGEILYKPAQSPFALGLDIHRVRNRDYDMRFNLLDYETTVGHLTLYYDAGRIFNIEINAGRYLAGDWGATATVSRKFGSGWEAGGYATLTDVPFDTFGEGSFDKAIYVSVPLDWIVSSPNQARRRLTLRPITRDGGAQLGSARQLYRMIKDSQYANFLREMGRLWK